MGTNGAGALLTRNVLGAWEISMEISAAGDMCDLMHEYKTRLAKEAQERHEQATNSRAEGILKSILEIVGK